MYGKYQYQTLSTMHLTSLMLISKNIPHISFSFCVFAFSFSSQPHIYVVLSVSIFFSENFKWNVLDNIILCNIKYIFRVLL